jgi:hypothetical protein
MQLILLKALYQLRACYLLIGSYASTTVAVSKVIAAELEV